MIEISSTAEIVESPYTLLYFYAPDCKFCNEFEPDFTYLEGLYEDNDDLRFAKVNGRKQKQLIDLFGISLFPTLKIYDTNSKTIAHFQQRRTLENLEDFIARYTSATPNEGAFQSNIKILSSLSDLDDYTTDNNEVVIAFISRRSPEWLRHYYPNHFYQQLATQYKDTAFAMVFADEEGMEILAKYQVSNFPSLMAITRNSIRTFNTFSTNVMSNNDLDEGKVKQFLKEPESLNEYQTFTDIKQLEKHATSREYEGHKQLKPGMNIGNMAPKEAKALDEEYEELLRDLEL